jgi:uncharacterized protein (TIGR02246 family)
MRSETMSEVTEVKRVIDRFTELIGRGDVDGALALYDEEAAFIPEPGTLVKGRRAVRGALEPLAALRPRIRGEIEKVVIAVDTALVINSWTLIGTDPDGVEVEQRGKSADVLRRRADGSWGILIDDPWGGG